MNPAKTGSEHILFFDTYALYAIVRGWPGYAAYAKGKEIMTTLMNLYELYYVLRREAGHDIAESAFQHILPRCTPITPDAVQTAALFKHEFAKRGLSYVDALGYVIAREQGIPFLTGDDGFKGIAGVEFVK